jgi:hypothetical protein
MRNLCDRGNDHVTVRTDTDGVMIDLVIARCVAHPGLAERAAGR